MGRKSKAGAAQHVVAHRIDPRFPVHLCSAHRTTTIISEYYQLRRNAIKDISSYLGFLVGFIGSAPFAWGLLALQLDVGRFARGLWYFFGIVTTAGIFGGVAGLGIGTAAGLAWEQIHRHRRSLPQGAAELAKSAGETGHHTDAVVNEGSGVPKLQLIAPSSTRSPNPDRHVEHAAADNGFPLRDLILAVIVLGSLGLIAELFLQEHTESWQQWIPFVVLGLGLAATGVVRVRPSRGTLRVFQLVMLSFLAAGLLGVYLHYAGNVEFEIERKPELSGIQLLWKALRGATPALAPGALAQIGLLGFIYAYRHPAIDQLSQAHGEKK